ncbi:hexamerin 70a precursor [Apis mellifera carnica]|nr:hexamerin 70a precursor [Apis mellifera carnica]
MFIPSHQVWLVGLLAFSLVGAEYYDTKTADKDFLLKQKKVYNLLYRVAQPALANITWYNEGQAWNIEANIDSYTNAAAVKGIPLDIQTWDASTWRIIFSLLSATP